MKKIHLEWDDGDGLVKQGILIPENTPEKVILQAMELALATGEDEINKFLEIMEAYGYPSELEEVQDVYIFECCELSLVAQYMLSNPDDYTRILDEIKNSSEEERDALYESFSDED